jgi:hypothetical protein
VAGGSVGKMGTMMMRKRKRKIDRWRILIL